MGWQDDAIVSPAPPAPAAQQPWEKDQILAPAAGPRVAHGVWDAAVAGWQGSIPGLVDRGKLPDVVLDPHHSHWYEKLVAGASQLVNEGPEMLGGMFAGAAAGTAIAPVAGTAIGAGAGAFAAPTAIRESLVQSYSKGEVVNSADFLSRASIVLKATVRDAVIGGLTAGAGLVAGKVAAPLVGDAVMAGRIGANTARVTTDAAQMGAEATTMVVAPAALEGRLPEPEDFSNAAIMMLGLKGAGAAAGKLRRIYAETGVPPQQVAADAKADPTILEDLAGNTPTPAERWFTGSPEAGRVTSRPLAEQSTRPNAEGQFAGPGQYISTSRDMAGTYGGPTGRAYEVQAPFTNPFDFNRVDPATRQSGKTQYDALVAHLGSKGAANAELQRRGFDAITFTSPRGERIANIFNERPMTDVGAAREPAKELGELSLAPMEGGGAKPTVAYHGTDKTFAEFDAAATRDGAFHFSAGPDVAGRYATSRSMDGGRGANVRPVHLDMQNPKRVDLVSPEVIEQAKAEGHDSLIVRGNHYVVFDAKQIKSAFEAPPADNIPRAYQSTAQVVRAQDAVPGVKAAEAATQPFGPAKQAAGEPARPTEVNYNYINTTDDAKGAMARLSAVYEAEIQNQRRGTVTWEQTQAEAGTHVAELLGTDTPFEPRQPGTPAGAAELLARKQMLQGAAEDMARHAALIRDLGTNATPEQTAAFLASIDRAAMIQAEFLGARAETGRALNILKETKVAAERAQQIQDLIARFGKKPEELAAMLAEIDNPTGMLKFAKDATKATTWEKIVEAWKAGLVSGPFTQMANVMGNLSFTAVRPAVDAVSAAFGMLSRAPERVSAVEPLARILGNLQGVPDGLRMAKSAFFEDAAGGKAEHRHAIEGTLGTVIRTPFRMLGAGDALFRTMIERGETYALATRQAAKEGLGPASREFRERVAQLVNEPTPEMQSQAADAGTRFTFNAPLGEKGRAVHQFVKVLRLQWAVPFISTPGNVFKEMARMTPAAPLIGEWRADIAAGGPRAHKAMAEMALGTGLSVLAASWAMSGHISGAGDPDPNKRRVKLASGWQPYSIKIGNTWYNYQRMQPLGTLMGLAADMAEAWEHLTPEESDGVPKILATAFANAVTNQTFLQGMANVVDALSDPDRKGPKFIQNMAASTVPGVVGQTASMLDPYMREISSVKQAVVNRIPGLRESIPPQRDPFGEPVQNRERVAGITPVTKSTESTDKVRTEAARLNVGAANAPKSIEMPAAGDSKLGKVALTPEQRDVFGDVAGHLVHQVMGQMVNNPGWDYMPDFVKQRTFQMAFEHANKAGKFAALSDAQRQKEITRIVGEIGKRMTSHTD